MLLNIAKAPSYRLGSTHLSYPCFKNCILFQFHRLRFITFIQITDHIVYLKEI